MTEDLDLTWEVTEDPDPESSKKVDEGLHSFNLGSAPLSESKSMACFVRKEGQIIGGAVGRRWGKGAELQQIWVHADHRGRGHGGRLMDMFEGHARERGCEWVLLDTYSFQAPDFYRRRRYETVATFTGFPDGIERYYMMKQLGA